MKKLVLGLFAALSLGMSSLFAGATSIEPYMVITDNNNNSYVKSYIYDGASGVNYQYGKWVSKKAHSGSAYLYVLVEGTNINGTVEAAVGSLDGRLLYSYSYGRNARMYKFYLDNSRRTYGGASGTVFTLYRDSSGHKFSYDTWLTYP